MKFTPNHVAREMNTIIQYWTNGFGDGSTKNDHFPISIPSLKPTGIPAQNGSDMIRRLVVLAGCLSVCWEFKV